MATTQYPGPYRGPTVGGAGLKIPRVSKQQYPLVVVETFVAEVATNGLKGRCGRVARSELWHILTGAGVGRAQSWGSSTVTRSATYFDP